MTLAVTPFDWSNFTDEMTEENFGLEDLPEELLQRILHEVSHGDLCSVARASSKLYLSATTPALWVRCPINKELVSLHGVNSIELFPRFSKLAVLNLGGTFLKIYEYSSVCSHVVSSRTIEELHLDRCSLKGVADQLLADLIVKLKKCNLGNTELDEEQKKAIFTRIATSQDLTLVDLNLFGQDLSQLDPELVGKGVCSVAKVDLGSSNITEEQKIQIFTANLDRSSKLSILDLSNVDANVRLSHIDPHLLGESWSKLSVVDLRGKFLTDAQKTAIASHVISSSKVKELNLSGVTNLSCTAGLLGKAVSHVPKVDLSLSRLPTSLATEVLSVMATSRYIIDLNLHGVDLSEVGAEVIAQAVSRLVKADLSNTDLTSAQLAHLFMDVLAGSRLEKLYLSNVDLSQVNPDVLAKAVSQMKRVDLMDTDLTGYQTTALLTRCLHVGHTRLALSGDRSGVPGDLVEKAKSSGRIHLW